MEEVRAVVYAEVTRCHVNAVVNIKLAVVRFRNRCDYGYFPLHSNKQLPAKPNTSDFSVKCNEFVRQKLKKKKKKKKKIFLKADSKKNWIFLIKMIYNLLWKLLLNDFILIFKYVSAFTKKKVVFKI